MNVDEHAEDLAADLGVDTEAVKGDLENLLAYSVPVEEAKQSLRRKYGDEDDSGNGPTHKEIRAVTPDDAAITVTARVLTVGKRSIRYQGEDRVITEGTLGDQTGRISYTAWEDFGLEPGETITIANASVREWEGNPEVNLGENSRVSREDGPLEVPYEIGGDTPLVDLESGDRGINVEVRVVEVERRTIDGRDGETEILSGVLADETARLPFTDWEPHGEIDEGVSLRLENVYVREFRGVPSINISEFSKVNVLDESVQPSEAAVMTIREAVETGGLFDVQVTGHVVGVRDGSGLIQRCPECGRLVQKGQCRSHGEVEGIDDLRVKAIVDDGTGTLTAILDEDLTAEVYGGGLSEARTQAREAMDQEVVADRIREQIVGREFVVRGNLSVDEYGANLEATAFERVEEDPADLASRFLESVRA